MSIQIDTHAAQPSEHGLHLVHRALGQQDQKLVTAKPNC
jgi:hypothetical protein